MEEVEPGTNGPAPPVGHPGWQTGTLGQAGYCWVSTGEVIQAQECSRQFGKGKVESSAGRDWDLSGPHRPRSWEDKAGLVYNLSAKLMVGMPRLSLHPSPSLAPGCVSHSKVSRMGQHCFWGLERGVPSCGEKRALSAEDRKVSTKDAERSAAVI